MSIRTLLIRGNAVVDVGAREREREARDWEWKVKQLERDYELTRGHGEIEDYDWSDLRKAAFNMNQLLKGYKLPGGQVLASDVASEWRALQKALRALPKG